MNTELISTITICITIAILIATICNIFVSCIVIIAKAIANEKITINLLPDLIIIVVCTFTICMYFLM